MQFPEWMSASDALTWHIERDPVLRSTISSVWWLDQSPDREQLEQALERMVEQVPRFRQRVVADRLGIAPPRWVEDRNFRLGSHLRFVDLGGSGQEADVLELASRNHSSAFDRDRALWNLQLVEGLEDQRSAIVLKLHHAIADGMGLVRMTGAMFQLERGDSAGGSTSRQAPVSPAEEKALNKSAGARSRPHIVDAVTRRVSDDATLTYRAQTASAQTLTRFAFDPMGVPVRLARTFRSILKGLAPASAPLSPLMTDRSLDFQLSLLSFPLDAFKATAQALDCSVNDVFMTGLIGGLQRYHRHHGKPAEQLRVTMPISIRAKENDQAGNYFVPARMVLRADLDHPAERLEALSRQLATERAEPGLPFFNEVSELVTRLGPTAATALLSGMLKASDLTASNVQGVPVPVYLAGARVDRMVPFGPCTGSAINVTLLSYSGEVVLGINCDQAAVPDPEVLERSLDESFQELFALGNVGAKQARRKKAKKKKAIRKKAVPRKRRAK